MFIYDKGNLFYIISVSDPYRTWYGVNMKIPEFSERYIEEKFGVVDPHEVTLLQKEFKSVVIPNIPASRFALEEEILNFDGNEYKFCLTDKGYNSVKVFLKKGFFTIADYGPSGYCWAKIKKEDDALTIQHKFYDDRKKFGTALYKKLKKIMGW